MRTRDGEQPEREEGAGRAGRTSPADAPERGGRHDRAAEVVPEVEHAPEPDADNLVPAKERPGTL